MKTTIYLDHAATSFPKPPAVLSAVTDCMKHKGGNPGRGSHRLALAAAKEIYACREVAAAMFGAWPDRVVFTLNTTHALNIAIKGITFQTVTLIIVQSPYFSTIILYLLDSSSDV